MWSLFNIYFGMILINDGVMVCPFYPIILTLLLRWYDNNKLWLSQGPRHSSSCRPKKKQCKDIFRNLRSLRGSFTDNPYNSVFVCLYIHIKKIKQHVTKNIWKQTDCLLNFSWLKKLFTKLKKERKKGKEDKFYLESYLQEF